MKAKDKLKTFVIGAVTTVLTSCGFNKKVSQEDAEKTKTEADNKGLRDLRLRNPCADTLHTNWNDSFDLFNEYAERYTDSAKIQNIKEKYKQQLSQYEHNLDSLTKMQHQVDAMLLEAASRGDMLGVKEALKNGADINAKDKTGKTALICAVSKSEQHKYYETADYLLGEPGIRTNIQDKNKLSARDYINTLVTKYDAEWKNILRKLDEPTTERRNRGNSNVERFASLVEKEYNQLMDTYGKEMYSALGYIYEGYLHYDLNIGRRARSEGREILINEDGSTDTLQVDPRQTHPCYLAKLKLQKPRLIDRTAEVVGKPSIIYTEEHKRHNNKYLQRYKVKNEVTVTRDGKLNKKIVSRSRS